MNETTKLVKIKDLEDIFQMLNGIDTSINDKLSYAIKKVKNKIQNKLKYLGEEVNERVEDLNIDFCDKDEKGHILLNTEGKRTFTNPDNLKKLNKLAKLEYKAYGDIEIEVDSHTVSVESAPRIAELDQFLIEELKGIIF